MVTHVADGDSLTVETGEGELEIRLAGVNAPEVGECFHDQAEENLRRWTAGAPVELEIVGEDQFGRSLAYARAGETLLNLELVATGSAIATTPEPDSRYGSDLLEAEAKAFSARIGLWDRELCGGSLSPAIAITVSPDPPGPDGEALDDEWVALSGSERVDLPGWVLRDESSAHRCTLPAGSVIEQGRPLIVTSADPCWAPGGSPVWNNQGDLVLLLDDRGAVAARHRYPD